MKIGIPKALMYFEFGKKWERFFREIGVDIILSPDTNKDIYDDGVKNTLTDYCLPVKVFVGHVLWLKDRCDLVFIPRYTEDKDWVFHCPNLIGSADLIRNTFPEIRLLESNFKDDFESYDYIANSLGRTFNNRMLENVKNAVDVNIDYFKNKTVAIVGRSYCINDGRLSMNIRQKLKEHNLDSVSDINPEKVEIVSHWISVNKLAASMKRFNEDANIAGIIYIKPFNCGPDFIIDEIAYIKKPFLVLSLDEHNSETGMLTRLEAFMDLL